MRDYEQNIIKKLHQYSYIDTLDGTIARNLIKLANQKEKLRLKYVAFLSNCSTSAIFKFINQRLQVDSFAELKFILAKSENVLSENNLNDFHLQMMIKNFILINQMLDNNKIKAIIKQIYQWNTIWCIAKGDTFTIVYDLVHKLRRMGFSANSIIAESQLSLKKMAIKNNDGVIFISIGGKTRELIDLITYINNSNIDFLVFTSNKKSSLAKINDQKTIIIPREEAIITNILFTQKQYYIFALDKILSQIIFEKGDLITKNANKTRI